MTRAEEKPFSLRAGESIRDGVRRIARAEIDAVIVALRGPLHEKSVHDVRKATKRLRALLRLLRDQLGARRYRRENRTFRDAARALSPARDAEVLVASVGRLAGSLDGKRRVLAPVTRVARHRLRAARRSTRPGAMKKRIVASMRRARSRVAAWPIADDGWKALAPGARRIYRKGRSAWRTAEAAPTVANLHEWRKRAKDLRYALDLFEPLWPPVLEALADETDALGDRLGEDHDLALLRRFVRDVLADEAASRDVLAEIDVSRRRLQAESWTRAARLYETPPGPFMRRLGTYWRAWEAEKTPDDEDAIAAAPSDDRRLARA
jgi:CHAD domain-containing protein